MRGRPFGFLGTLCTVWIASRIGFLSAIPVAVGEVMPTKHSGRNPDASVENGIASAPAKSIITGCCEKPSALDTAHRVKLHLPARPPAVAPALNVQPATPPTWPLLFQTTAQTTPLLAIWPAPVSPTPPSAFNFYAYRFHRSGPQTGGLNGGERYGSSQSGFVATYALAHDDSVALLARGAIAHDRLAERELAVGWRLQPFRNVPASITAERRFRNDRSDAFAVYLAGGTSGVALPLRFKAEGFVQAGVISDKRSGAFFDLAARADRKLLAVGRAPVAIGTGIWGGGQKGVFRIDAGPMIATEIPLDQTRLRISADWRFRIAGDARPASGPALTLSTSF